MPKFTFDISLLSKYRTQLMGIAILWIMIRHSDFNDTLVPFILRFIRRSGAGGVEMFFFLSGLGIYFGYQKSSNLKTFFKKRFMRILPYYIPIIILFTLLFQYPNGLITLKGVLLRIFILDYWVEGEGLGWYIPVALLFYILTPLIMKALNGDGNKNWIILIVGVFAGGLILDYFGYWYYMNTVMIRLASYIFGIHIGYMIANKININVIWLAISFVIGAVLYGLKYRYGYQSDFIYLYFDIFPFFFLSLPICAIFSYLFSLVKNYKFPILYFFGAYTLCIYIFHERIKLIMQYYDMQYVVIISALLAIVLAYVWQNFISWVLKKLKLN